MPTGPRPLHNSRSVTFQSGGGERMVGYWLKLAHAPTLLYSWPVEVPYPRVPLHVRLRSRLVFFVDPRPSGCEGCVWPPAGGGVVFPPLPGRLVAPPLRLVARTRLFSSLRSRNENHVWF